MGWDDNACLKYCHLNFQIKNDNFEWIMQMEWLFILFFAFILAITISYSYRYGITPTPTSAKVQQKLFAILPELESCEIAELGSGWGTLSFALARHFPRCQIRSYEISPFPFLVSNMVAHCLAYSNLNIERKDFFHVSLSDISLVVCYLYPGAMQKLKIKFEKELSLHAYIVSHTFAIPGWKPIRLVYADDLYHTPIYLYQKMQSLR